MLDISPIQQVLESPVQFRFHAVEGSSTYRVTGSSCTGLETHIPEIINAMHKFILENKYFSSGHKLIDKLKQDIKEGTFK